MQISSSTRISELIKANPAAIDAIASISRHFEKLRNPLLRKVLAPRVTIEEAARIGGCSLEDFFEKLRPLGFVPGEPLPSESPAADEPQFPASCDESKTITLDVRPDLAAGRDPFLKIMEAVTALPPGHALCIINTFEPLPLIHVLQKKGFVHKTTNPSPTLFQTYFIRLRPETKETPPGDHNTVSDIEFERTSGEFRGKTRVIDVRHLEMPQPMITILRELETLPGGFALYVHHKKVPLFLLPELKEKNYRCTIHTAGEGDVRLLIYR